MNTKINTALLLAALLTATAAAQTQQTQTSITEGPSANLEATFMNSDPAPLQSGEDGDITFKIVNTGDNVAENTKVELVDSYPFEIKPDRKRNYSLGDMQQGQEYQISTEVLVNEEASDGSNSLKIKVYRGDITRTIEIPVEVQSQDIELNVANLKTQPQQLMPDTDNNLMTVDVVNNGEKTAENTVVQLDMPEFFERTSSFSTRQALGNIQPGQVKSGEFNFDISEDAPSGVTGVNGSLSYSADDSTSEITEDIGFDLNLEGKPQFEVTDTESSLKTGSTGEVRIEVTNTGNEESSSTRIRALDSSDQPFTYDSSSQYIGTLESGASGTAVFEVETDSDASVKEYLMDFEIRGVKDTEVFVEDSTLNVEVENGETEGTSPLIPAAVVAVLLVLVYLFRGRIRQLRE